MASITMAHSAYIEPESTLLPKVAYNTLAVIKDTISLIPKASEISSIATGVLSTANDSLALGVGIYGVWSGVIEYNQLLPSSSFNQKMCVGASLTGGAARIARSITDAAKIILTRCSVLKAIPVLSGVYTALSGLVYSMLLIPRILDLIENMKRRNAFYAPEEYATEEESVRAKFELIKQDYVISEGDIQAYQALNSSKSRDEAIKALKAEKKKQVVSRYGSKTFEVLEKRVQIQVQAALPTKKEEELDISEIKEVVEIAKKEMTKVIKVKFALAVLFAITGISVVAITFATGGFSALFFQVVLLVSSIILALKDVYGLYQSCMSDEFKKSDGITLGLALSLIFLSIVIGSVDVGEFDVQSSVILGSWTLFAALSALFVHTKMKQTIEKKANL